MRRSEIRSSLNKSKLNFGSLIQSHKINNLSGYLGTDITFLKLHKRTYVDLNTLYIGDVKPSMFTYKNDEGEVFPLKVQHFTVNLLILEPFNNLRYFYLSDEFYIYLPAKGYYTQLNKIALRSLILRAVTRAQVAHHIANGYIGSVVTRLKDMLASGPLPIQDSFLIFKNGTYNLDTMTFEDKWSPKVFTTSALPYSYDPQAECPRFLEFLRENFSGDPNMVHFIRAYMKAILFGYTEAQIFVYLLGPGGTGKSTLANVLRAILGQEMVITTTLRDLHVDKFEGQNILGKKLILISDTEQYQGDMSVIKSISGGDALVGRTKHKQGSLEVNPEGLIIIVGNTPLGSRDSGGALSRRLREIRMEFKPKSPRELIYFNPRNKSWSGEFSLEMSGIFNFSVTGDLNFMKKSLEWVPTLAEQNHNTQVELNPMMGWIRSTLTEGPGAYIGYANISTTDKLLMEGARRPTLYTSYLIYYKLRGLKPLNHMRFTRELLANLLLEGYNSVKEKKTQGAFITGISLAPGAYDKDKLYGAPLFEKDTPDSSLEDKVNDSEEPLTTTSSDKNFPNVNKVTNDNNNNNIYIYNEVDLENTTSIEIPYKIASEKATLHIRDDLYKSYIKLLGKTDFKESINEEAKRVANHLKPEDFVLEHLKGLSGLSALDEHGKPMHVSSEVYKDRLAVLYDKALEKVRTTGMVPYKYKRMGLSPRIIPQAYGQSFNSVRKSVRYKILQEMGPFLKERGYTIYDVDIKSCYTSILLGLFPLELGEVHEAVKGKGLWKHIESEFNARSQGHLYNKPAVKICVYSSFFSGGPNAMIIGIMEYFQKELGMTPKEFRDSKLYEGLYNRAQAVASEMNESNIIKDFRHTASHIKNSFDGEVLVGPTGHKFEISGSSFQTAYPNYLQSYEFALIAETSLRFIEGSTDEPILLGHYHDGVLLAVPVGSEENSQKKLNEIILDLGRQIGLNYPQTLEFQATCT